MRRLRLVGNCDYYVKEMVLKVLFWELEYGYLKRGGLRNMIFVLILLRLILDQRILEK